MKKMEKKQVHSKPKERTYFLQQNLYTSAVGLTPIRVLHAGGGSDGSVEEWWSHFRPDSLIVDAFEPNQEEAARVRTLAQNHGYKVTCHQSALWSESGERDFYVTSQSGGSSLFRPDESIVSRLRYTQEVNLENSLKLIDVTRVSTNSIDDLARDRILEPFDFMKMNIQGAELAVLQGGESLLNDVIGIQAEVSFYRIYEDAPSFGQVETYLADHGLFLFDIPAPNTVGRCSMPFQPPPNGPAHPWCWPARQLMEAHCIFLRDPFHIGFADLSNEKLAKLICVAEIWGQLEYAFDLLDWVVQNRNDFLGISPRKLFDTAAQQYRRHFESTDVEVMP